MMIEIQTIDGGQKEVSSLEETTLKKSSNQVQMHSWGKAISEHGKYKYLTSPPAKSEF